MVSSPETTMVLLRRGVHASLEDMGYRIADRWRRMITWVRSGHPVRSTRSVTSHTAAVGPPSVGSASMPSWSIAVSHRVGSSFATLIAADIVVWVRATT